MPINLNDRYEIQIRKSDNEDEKRWSAKILDNRFNEMNFSSDRALFLLGMIIGSRHYDLQHTGYIDNIRKLMERSWVSIDDDDDKSRRYNSAINSIYADLKSIKNRVGEHGIFPCFDEISYYFDDSDDFYDLEELFSYGMNGDKIRLKEQEEIDKIVKPIDPRSLTVPIKPTPLIIVPNFIEKIIPLLLNGRRNRAEYEFQLKMRQYDEELKIIHDYTIIHEEYQKKANYIKREYEELQNVESKNIEIFEEFKNEIKSDLELIENSSYHYQLEQENCYNLVSSDLYPIFFLKEVACKYIESSSTLIVDYLLPELGDIIKYKEVKYIKSKETYKVSYISDKEHNDLYDNVLYQIALRTISELMRSNICNNIVFNGKVRIHNPANGKIEDRFILSIQISRDEFLKIDIKNVDPKICFRQLKGVGSSQLHSITSIRPIQNIDYEDKRFVGHYDIAHTLDEGVNIAAMDWLDFEHLVRELFEEEFRSEGGEVKITRASRDYGVDAVIFDPHPIRGGKLVIQAKRYTNTVEVSAVRDLYGTVMNEGAMKGILVTTSDYGPDAYSFAKGKPLTLLNGGELLNLLSKHGHKARIDIKEAKQLRQKQI
jgi:restriction system protein